MPAEAAVVSATIGPPRPVANAAAVPMVPMGLRLVIFIIVYSLIRQNGSGRSSRIVRPLTLRAFTIALVKLLPFGLPWQRKPLPKRAVAARVKLVNRCRWRRLGRI